MFLGGGVPASSPSRSEAGCFRFALALIIFFPLRLNRASTLVLMLREQAEINGQMKSEVVMTWYVVYKGKKPGVYESWATCSQRVNGIKKNSYKGFATREEAIASYLEFKGCEDSAMHDSVFMDTSETPLLDSHQQPALKVTDWRNVLIFALVLAVVLPVITLLFK